MSRARRLVRRLRRPRLTLPPDVLLTRNEHGYYAVPRSALHRPAARTTAAGQVWERETIELLRRTDSRYDVVHAGTFFGDFLPALARSRRRGARVWAFEPSAENFRCAKLTVSLNRLRNVVLTHAGLDATGGTGALAVTSADGRALGGGSHLVEDPPAGCAVEEVPLVAVDETVPADRTVGVIQLDVEGHESEALLGAMRTIRRCRPLLVLESPPDPEWFAAHLPDLGYAVTQRVADNSVLTPGQ